MSLANSARVNIPVLDFLGEHQLPYSATFSLLECPYTSSSAEKMFVTSFSEHNGEMLVNFHYKKGCHEDREVGHVRGWVVLYDVDKKPSLVCRGMRVPRILDSSEPDPSGKNIVRVVCYRGDTRLRMFSALGRVWFSTHRSLNCVEERWIENSKSFGEMLGLLDLREHFDLVQRGKVVSFTVSGDSAGNGKDGYMIWDPKDWSIITLDEPIPESYVNVTFYNTETGECLTRLSDKKLVECKLRGDTGSLYETFEKSYRENSSFPHLSEKEQARYITSRRNFISYAERIYNQRYSMGKYVHVNPHVHRFVKFLHDSRANQQSLIDRSEIEQLLLDYDSGYFSKLVTHSRSFLTCQ